ncbi:MAG: formylmethanofuran dehydrogenase subunit C [Pirellulaceae bacterium]|jgi:formylmethanofuran dehydrogenase subunit C
MSGWRLTPREVFEERLDASDLIPEKLLPKSLSEILSIPIPLGLRRVRLSELFEVSPLESDAKILFDGDCSGIDRLGGSMTSGRLQIRGNAGHGVGQSMQGGQIEVTGSVAEGAATDMRGGEILIAGNAGRRLGAPLPGERGGMRGGTLLVGGSLGAEALLRMRRGVVAVAGQAAEDGAHQMIAGTIVLLSPCGGGWASGMRRGSIIAMDASQPPSSSQADGALWSDEQLLELSFLPLLWNHLDDVLRRFGKRPEPPSAAPSTNGRLVNDPTDKLADKLAGEANRQQPFHSAWPRTRWAFRQIGDLAVGGRGERLWLRRLPGITMNS